MCMRVARTASKFCEALRRPSLCEVRDVNDEDKLVPSAYGLFSGKITSSYVPGAEKTEAFI